MTKQNAVKKLPKEEVKEQTVRIPAPKFQEARFLITGTEPLVIRRFSLKTKGELAGDAAAGKPAQSKKKRPPKNTDTEYDEARYRLENGDDGFNASSIRNAMISACRLVNYKMTLAKMSIFVIKDGVDVKEPQIPLIRIIGKPIKQMDMGRVATGAPYPLARPAYHNWRANVRIRFDADQFELADIANLLSRVGMQVGIGEGRPDSKNSAGMGWGLFTVERKNENKS